MSGGLAQNNRRPGISKSLKTQITQKVFQDIHLNAGLIDAEGKMLQLLTKISAFLNFQRSNSKKQILMTRKK